jgi:glycosyltransferase involved in cell wall biosynthesis
MSSIDVVIPTYNRGAALRATVSRILASSTESLVRVDVIVVDDGSAEPADRILAGVAPPPGVSFRVLRQPNSGPARARNAGFRVGIGEIVLFMDDDILPPPDLLRRHAVAHRERPGSVVCGFCEWLPPKSPGTLFRLLQRLGGERQGPATSDYALVSIVASGQLSVERRLFPVTEGVYRDDLVTPAAEEYELSLRLRRRGIPIFFAESMVAFHDSSVALVDVCRQQYKHGFGCGEAARRCPETLELEELARIVGASRTEPSDTPSAAGRKKLKALGASRALRSTVLHVAGLVERFAPQVEGFGPLYRLAIALHFTAGVRDGLDRLARVS